MLINEKTLQALSENGRLLARGILVPSGVLPKKRPEQEGLSASGESRAEFEIRKSQRRRGIQTPSKKPNNLEKEGFDRRSFSLVYYERLFADVGFLVTHIANNRVQQVCETTVYTGFGKKLPFKKSPENKLIAPAEVENQLKKLWERQKANQHLDLREKITSEVLYCAHEDDYEAIFYTQDYFVTASGELQKQHPFSSLLQALYLQQTYEKCCHRALPIFKYSCLTNHFEALPLKSEDDILTMWIDMCFDYLKQAISPHNVSIFNQSVEAIKMGAMYGHFARIDNFTACAACTRYAPGLQKKINEGVETLMSILKALNGRNKVDKNLTGYPVAIDDRRHPLKHHENTRVNPPERGNPPPHPDLYKNYGWS